MKPTLAASALLAGFLAGRSLDWPLIHDAPLFHYVAWLMGQGLVPYRDIFDMNLPGVYLLHWAVLAMLLTLALLAFHPVAADHIYALVDPWQPAPQGALYVVALVLMTLVFLAVRLVLAWTPARLALTPGATLTQTRDAALRARA